MLVEARQKCGLLDKEMKHDAVAEGISMRQLHADIIRRTISNSQENIRVSMLVDKASNTTKNFTIQALDSIPAQYGECGLVLNISCRSIY